MEKIEHSAVVISVDKKQTEFELIDNDENCSACAIAAFCNIKNTRKIKISHENLQGLKVNDRVILRVDESIKIKGIILLFALPSAVLFAALAAMKYCGYDDIYCAAGAVLAVGVYFFVLYLFKNRFNKIVEIVRENA